MPAGRPAVLTEEERLRRKNLRSQRYYEANKNYWVERRHRLQESGVCLNYCKCSAAQLGVTNYTALTLNWLTKVPDNIYSVLIEMRDDNNQPVFLPDNGPVNVEIAFKYD